MLYVLCPSARIRGLFIWGGIPENYPILHIWRRRLLGVLTLYPESKRNDLFRWWFWWSHVAKENKQHDLMKIQARKHNTNNIQQPPKPHSHKLPSTAKQQTKDKLQRKTTGRTQTDENTIKHLPLPASTWFWGCLKFPATKDQGKTHAVAGQNYWLPQKKGVKGKNG